jgi:hypothetical protein
MGFWPVLGILLGVILAPRMTLGILLCALGYNGIGVICIIWSIIVGIVNWNK